MSVPVGVAANEAWVVRNWLVASAVVLIGVPLWFYPRSKMIWTAVEFLVLRGTPEYRPPVARDARQRELE